MFPREPDLAVQELLLSFRVAGLSCNFVDSHGLDVDEFMDALHA
jgi:hypothetical protein